MKRQILLAASVLVGLGAVGVNAQETRPRTDPQQPEVYRPQESAGMHTRASDALGGIVKGSELIGVNIEASDGENIGSVKDLIIGSDGRVAVALLEVDGVDDAQVGVPFKALKCSTGDHKDRTAYEDGSAREGVDQGADDEPFAEEDPFADEDPADTTTTTSTGMSGKAHIKNVDSVMLSLQKTQLSAGPKWTQEGSTSLDSFVSSVYSHFGNQMGGQTTHGMGETGDTGTGRTGEDAMGKTAMGGPKGPFVLASRVLDSSVANNEQEDLGEIEDMALSLANEKVLYAVLDHGGVLGMGEKQFAVPWEALQARDQGAQITVNVTEQQLSQAEGFQEWPASADNNLFRPTTRTLPESGDGMDRR